jgi:carboxyl-terminal processing protease
VEAARRLLFILVALSVSGAAWAQAQQPGVQPPPAPELVRSTPEAPPAKPAQPPAAVQLIQEALRLVGEKSLQPGPALRDARAALRRYVRGLDQYSGYLSPAEYAAHLEQQRKGYAGVGMDILPKADGRIICLPKEGGPAHQAGVRAGDVLLAVDDRLAAGQSHYIVAGWILGPSGTKLNLTLQRQSLRLKLDIERRPLTRSTVELLRLPKQGALLRISSFNKGTAEELYSGMQKAQGAAFLVLDLRQNPGGDFLEAMRAASLFLEPGVPLLQLKGRNGEKILKSGGLYPPSTAWLFIWQDAATASAAEALILALAFNQRALTLGWPSFGKGSMQKVLPLKDGSALILTSALILDPAGKGYQGRGIMPAYPLPPCLNGCYDVLLQKTLQIADPPQ